jgi:uncharacterized protein (TIGR00299 family) protein
MKIAYFDTISGISGDMALGALLNAGISTDKLREELRALNVPGFEIEARHVERNGITALKVNVIISEEPHYHRHLPDIESLIDGSAFSGSVKERSKRIFREVAAAESKIHGIPIEKVHFHEVGAVDSLVDIVGVSICLEKLGIQDIYCSPVKVGNGGFVKAQHGMLPVPTPATVEILKNYPILLTDIPFELTTPTGAAIVTALSKGVLASEKIRTTAIGYGAGEREIEKIPNLLRVIVGELESGCDADEVIALETNIDDLNPEIYPFVIEKLLEAGAYDAYAVPLIMKKGRPGIMLSALAERGKLDQVLDVLFRETTTIGVRIQPVERKKLPRSTKQVKTSLGIVNAKAIVVEGRERLRVEFEECKRIAVERGIPLIEVYKLLERELSS